MLCARYTYDGGGVHVKIPIIVIRSEFRLSTPLRQQHIASCCTIYNGADGSP